MFPLGGPILGIPTLGDEDPEVSSSSSDTGGGSSEASSVYAPAILIGHDAGKPVFAVPACENRSASSAAPKEAIGGGVCDCKHSSIGIPEHFTIDLDLSSGDGSCDHCENLSDTYQVPYFKYDAELDQCLYQVNVEKENCSGADNFDITFGIGANDIRLSISAFDGEVVWKGPHHFFSEFYLYLSEEETTSKGCLFPLILKVKAKEMPVNACRPIGTLLPGLLIGHSDDKPLFAGGTCLAESVGSSRSGSLKAPKTVIPKQTYHVGFLVGEESGKPLLAVHCCNGAKKSTSSSSSSGLFKSSSCSSSRSLSSSSSSRILSSSSCCSSSSLSSLSRSLSLCSSSPTSLSSPLSSSLSSVMSSVSPSSGSRLSSPSSGSSGSSGSSPSSPLSSQSSGGSSRSQESGSSGSSGLTSGSVRSSVFSSGFSNISSNLPPSSFVNFSSFSSSSSGLFNSQSQSQRSSSSSSSAGLSINSQNDSSLGLSEFSRQSVPSRPPNPMRLEPVDVYGDNVGPEYATDKINCRITDRKINASFVVSVRYTVISNEWVSDDSDIEARLKFGLGEWQADVVWNGVKIISFGAVPSFSKQNTDSIGIYIEFPELKNGYKIEFYS